jgi:DNA-binding MarR family transcriptional regulator
MAPGLQEWPVFISKKQWSLEEENRRILEQIKDMKRDLKLRCREYHPELTKTQYRILISLAVQGPAHSRYKLTTRKIKGERIGDKETIRRDLDILKSQYLIQTSESPGGRRPKNIELTTAGLFRLLGSEWPELWQDFDKLARTNESKVPLIFGNWQKFIKDGTADDFKEGILNYFKNPEQSYITAYDLLVHLRPTEFSEKGLTDDLTRHILLPQLFHYIYRLFLPYFSEPLISPFEPIQGKIAPSASKKEVEIWFESVARYSELKDYLQKELCRLEQDSENFAFTIKNWKNILNRL